MTNSYCVNNDSGIFSVILIGICRRCFFRRHRTLLVTVWWAGSPTTGDVWDCEAAVGQLTRSEFLPNSSSSKNWPDLNVSVLMAVCLLLGWHTAVAWPLHGKFFQSILQRWWKRHQWRLLYSSHSSCSCCYKWAVIVSGSTTSGQ